MVNRLNYTVELTPPGGEWAFGMMPMSRTERHAFWDGLWGHPLCRDTSTSLGTALSEARYGSLGQLGPVGSCEG